MPLEDLIITVYCSIEEMYQEATKGTHLRFRGETPLYVDKWDRVNTLSINAESLSKVWELLDIVIAKDQKYFGFKDYLLISSALSQ